MSYDLMRVKNVSKDSNTISPTLLNLGLLDLILLDLIKQIYSFSSHGN